MNLNNDVKRHFPVTVIAVIIASIVVSSTPILNSAYAEGSDVYRPSYTWAERPQRTFQTPDLSKYANPIQDPILFQAPDLSKYANPIRDPIVFQAPDLSKYATPIQDPIAFQTPDLSKYATPDVYRPSHTWVEQLVNASEIHERMAGDLGQSIYQGFNHLPADIKPVIKDTIGYIPNKVGTVINTLFIDVPDIVRTQDNTLRNLKGAKAFIDVANPFPTSTLEWAAQRDWDIIPPELYIPTEQDIEEFQDFRSGIMEGVTVQEFRNNELIPTQHYETLDIDNWREELQLQEQDVGITLDDAFYQEQYQSEQFRIHDPILDFQEPSIDLQSYEPAELSQSYTDNLRFLETKIMTDAHTSLFTQSSFDSLKAPDFSDYQNVSNQINPQFNNLPSRSTVFRDHLLYNDVGRSFRQQQIYQSPSIVDLGTIRISAPSIQMPRYDPIQMPMFEPVHIEPIQMPPMPMPRYDPMPMTYP